MVAMIGSERDRVIFTSRIAASRLFVQQHADQRHHIRITIQMRRFLERPVRVFAHVTQMGKVDAMGDFCGNRGYIVGGVRPKRALT